jgi:YfiH family protein
MAFGARESGEHDRERLSRALGLPRVVHMRQVHGNDVVSVNGRPEAPPACDGLVTDAREVGLVVQTADCVPLLFWASRRNAVAAVHAGWRGTLARVASRAVRTLRESFGVAPDELHVALGPSIRVCCFEVGDEVSQAFADTGRALERIARTGPSGKTHLDLAEDNREQLRATGVPDEQIYDCGRCTYCEVERFYSYRREGNGVGRLMGIVGVRS